MGKKGLLLVFISDFKKNNQPSSYKVSRYVPGKGRVAAHESLAGSPGIPEFRSPDGDGIFNVTKDGEEWWIEGTQTNDAPVKYLLSRASTDGNPIEKIICIVSQKVRESGFAEFKAMVRDYIAGSEELRKAYSGQQIDEEKFFHAIDYPESEAEISARASKVYSQLAAPGCVGGEAGAGVYIDYTGGLRDMNFLMTAIIRYLEYHGVSCEEIVYSSYDRDHPVNNKIYSLRCIYDMYQLLNGVEQFVDTGNAELLQSCYGDEEESGTKELLEQIVSFSHAMSLCDVRNVDQIMEKLCESLDDFDAKEDKGSFFSVMFGDLTSIIRRKLYIEKGRGYSYPRLIQWCLDNNMVQQALTLYIEKMPEFYCSQGLLQFSEEEAQKSKKYKKSLGQSWRTEYFYGPFYDQFVMPELRRFSVSLKEAYEALKNTCSPIESFDPRDFRKLKSYMKTQEEKKAVDRLTAFLEKNYGKTAIEIHYPDTGEKMENCPGSANGFVKNVINNPKWQVWFLYNDKRKCEEYHMGTYEKKVLALDGAKGYQGSDLLYNIMKYYLALKLLRNRINHASEQETQEDEGKAIEKLQKDHGLCLKVEFQSIKSLLQEGINLWGGGRQTRSVSRMPSDDMAGPA